MRYLPHTEASRKEMMKTIGITDIDTLYQSVPQEFLLKEPIDALPAHQSEQAVEQALTRMAAKNTPASAKPFFLGAGSYRHHIPASVDYIIQRSEFLTSYTPYQPEVSQGTLMYIFEFQTYIAKLTGMDIANASMYDGATSVTEAALMTKRLTKRDNVMVMPNLHPMYKDTLRTYTTYSEGTVSEGTEPTEDTACLVVQTPDFYGNVVDLAPYRAACDKVGAKLVVAVTEIISLGMLPAPKEADIVAGEAQSIGVPMGFGGPHLGFFACKQEYLRQMPGRLCGKTKDADGKEGYVLTLNTREQHIRREKATSNICTNQGLCALAFTVHLSLLGETGLKQLAQLNHQKACQLADKLSTVKGLELLNNTFFNEFTVRFNQNAKLVAEKLSTKGIIPGYVSGENTMLLTATELTSENDMDQLVQALTEALSTNGGYAHAV